MPLKNLTKKTQELTMDFSKTLIGPFSLLLLSISSQAFACPEGLTAWVRDASGKLVQSPVTIDGLKNGSFETDHFKVVVDKGTDAVSVDDPAYCARASHVLYTLENARATIASKLGDDTVGWMPQITARLEIKSSFSNVVHFQADSRGESYNNALSIPTSGSERIDSVAPWGVEIWFRPAKKLKEESELEATGDAMGQAGFKKMVAENAVAQGVLSMSQDAGTPALWSQMNPTGEMIGIGLTLGVTEIAPFVLKGAGKLFPSVDYLDTAMIPEIVDHEYSHTLLSRHIPLNISTPVVEGYANYFAGVISGRAKLADHAGKFSKDEGKNGLDKTRYKSTFETNTYAFGNFVFSTLWKVRQKLGPDLGDRVVYASHFSLTEDSDIRSGMTSALFDAADTVAKTPSAPSAMEMHLQLHQILQDVGL
jgi:hypothetical protein